MAFGTGEVVVDFGAAGADSASASVSRSSVAAATTHVEAYLFPKSTAAGGGDAQIEVVASGRARVKLAPADTASLAPCRLDGDLWVYTSDVDAVCLAVFSLQVGAASTVL